jgi:plastocyanin
MMSTSSRKSSVALQAALAGLAFTTIYGGFEFSGGLPEGIAIDGDTNKISVFHFPLIWLLSGMMFYGAFHALGAMRVGTARKRPAAFGASVALALVIAWFWAAPLIGRLTRPAEPGESSLCGTRSVIATPTTGPVTIGYSDAGFCPVHVTIRKGNTVTFVADEEASLRIASDYPPLNHQADGRAYSLTFTEVGTYSYSDDPSTRGLRKLISELLGDTQAFQGTVVVAE